MRIHCHHTQVQVAGALHTPVIRVYVNMWICACTNLYIYVYKYDRCMKYILCHHTQMQDIRGNTHARNMCVYRYVIMCMYEYVNKRLHPVSIVYDTHTLPLLVSAWCKSNTHTRNLSIREYLYMCIYEYVHIRLHTVRTPYDMGWLRLVGSLKLYVSFAEYHLFYRAFLRKRPIILRSLLIVATPYAYSVVALKCTTQKQYTRKYYVRVCICAYMSIYIHVCVL